MYKLILGIAAGLLLFSNTAMALCSSYPYTLTNGATADATQVMANFNCAALTSGSTLQNTLLTGTTSVGTAAGYANGMDIVAVGASLVLSQTNSASYAGMRIYNNLGSNIHALEIDYSGSSYPTNLLAGGPGGESASIGTTGNYPLALGTSNTARITISGGGSVGVGTSSPGYLLHVDGTAYATGAAGALSDIRHKKDIEGLPDGALGDVIRLHPVSFHWRDPKDTGMQGRQMGFIAQEVEKILPSVVLTETNAEKTKGLKYNELIALLTKAIQEQQAQIQALKAEGTLQVKALKAANDNQAAEITRLESQMAVFQRKLGVQAARN